MERCAVGTIMWLHVGSSMVFLVHGSTVTGFIACLVVAGNCITLIPSDVIPAPKVTDARCFPLLPVASRCFPATPFPVPPTPIPPPTH